MYKQNNVLRKEIQEIFKDSIVIGEQETHSATSSMFYTIVNKNTGKELSIIIPFVSDKFYLSVLDDGTTVVESFKKHLIESIKSEIL